MSLAEEFSILLNPKTIPTPHLRRMGCKHYDSLAAATESRETPESLRLSEMPGVVGDADRHESRRT